ncbi:MAG: asparagine synthetase B, partial [Pelagibacteraceae bacterium]|nr:asparagine synthetase B [Pelagibacteraceae bacterium]
MCGICGIYNFNQKKISKNELKIMNDQMISRGPDAEGYLLENNFGMAMRRLSIIDIDKSNQPISNESQNISIIFNGEIYNFIEIRKQLLSDGVNFQTNGDTEVILKLYEKFGEKFISKLIGMFSICIFDKIKKKILIYRDRFGIKPLYYYYDKNSLYFASSLFSLKKVLKLKKSKDAFFLYLCLNYFPSKISAYEDVNSLLPKEYIKIENNRLSIQKYEIEIHSYENFNQSKFKDII